jgi:rhamnulose-1-phosphate aldolase
VSSPTLDQILAQIGDTGLRMAQIDAAEGAAGNISVYVADELRPDGRFDTSSEIDLPATVPSLAGGWVVVTGTGRRLRDAASSPETAVCLLRILEGGRRAVLYGTDGVRPTSELNTHLAVHDDHAARRGVRLHGIVHAQPIHLTYLSHLPSYQETRAFNRRLLRWQPETIVEFPEGIGVLPFQAPGSADQMGISAPALARYRAIVWSRHGIVTRSDKGAGKAGDLVEYAEAAARYEYLNLAAGEPTAGLSDEEMRLICERLQIEQEYF